ncbi:MAG: HAD family phosphatase [Chloroflexota bacterium]|nr:HAD family phosphatase [Chloroflexota bacterium]
MTGYRAILFDMDGVLVDSEPLFLSAINRLLVQEGVEPVSVQENEEFLIGTTIGETWRQLKIRRPLPLPAEEYINRYDDIVRQVMQEELEPQPGVRELIQACNERGLPKAVASSSLHMWVDLKLGAIGLTGAFDAVLGGDDVTRGKPEPDIYIKAAESLGVPPGECIAIEDSPIGIAAAVASGAYTICVRTEYTRNLDVSLAHTILETLEEFDLSLLANGPAGH